MVVNWLKRRRCKLERQVRDERFWRAVRDHQIALIKYHDLALAEEAWQRMEANCRVNERNEIKLLLNGRR